ncbi:MAG: amidohydrolase [Candidatus Eisenbacteria bacterium]|nr:amidohydrolase [Candidatus Eisenbacteria bacterium]
MLVLFNGRIGWGAVGETALLARAGIIEAVGGDGEILDLAPARAERIDLRGGLLLPGFTDAHVHLLHLGRLLHRTDLGEALSLAGALERIERTVRESAEPVLFFEGADESLWPERRLPTRRELDRLEPRRPLLVRRVCMHIAVANGPALERIGARRPDVDPESGRCEEESVLHLEDGPFRPSEEEDRRAVLRAQERALSFGVTTVHEIDSPRFARVWRALESEGRLRTRVFFYAASAPEETAELAAENREGDLFRVAGVKAFLDGSIGGCTAAVTEPYPTGGDGTLLLERDAVEKLIRKAEELELPVALHAIGDRAIEEALAAHEAIRREGPPPVPHRIEHAEMLTPAQAGRVRRQGLLLSMQPNFPLRWGGPGGLYETRVGRERARGWNRIGEWIRAGIPVAFGSDGMPFDPFTGMEGAVRHPVPAERISPEEAFHAYSGRAERFVPGGGAGGSIAPGRRADLILFDGPPAEGEPLRRERLARVFAAGETVYVRE